jgi:hypothetical protein
VRDGTGSLPQVLPGLIKAGAVFAAVKIPADKPKRGAAPLIVVTPRAGQSDEQ